MKSILAKAGCAVIVMILLICLAFIQVQRSSDDAVCIDNPSEGITVGPIDQGKVIKQTFYSEYNGLRIMHIQFATYARINSSDVTIQLYDERSKELIMGRILNAAELADNEYIEIDIPQQNDSKGKYYAIVIYSNADSDNAVTIWASEGTSYLNGELFVNDTAADMDISFKVGYNKTLSTGFSKFLIMTVMMLLCGVSAVSYALISKKYNLLALKIVFGGLFSIFFAVAFVGIYCYIAPGSIEYEMSGANCVRGCIFAVIGVFAYLNIIVEKEKLWNFIFEKRWYAALFAFIFAFSLKLNFSNVSCFDFYIQPDIRSEYTQPVLGISRDIRSDEWLVETPRRISGSYSDYGPENHIMRGTENKNLPASNLYKGYSALYNPFNWGFLLFGPEYGMSWLWCGLYIMSFMVSFELSLILSKGKRFYALLGAVLISLSSFSLWWSIMTYSVSMQGIIVCAYHFINTDSRKKRILLAVCFSFAFSFFVCSLYPAWQVPLAYILMAFAAWLLLDYFDRIRSFKAADWLILGAAVVFSASVILAYLYDMRDYTQGIMGTVYPGARFDTGGFSLSKIFCYPQSLFYSFHDTGNNSEAGVFYCLFPIPIIFSAYIAVKQIIAKIKDKSVRMDKLNLCLLAVGIFLITYCTVGFPKWLAGITLMSYSTALRAVDFISLLCIYMMIRHFSEDNEKFRLPLGVCAIITFISVIISMYYSQTLYPTYLTQILTAISALLTFGFGMAYFTRISEKNRNFILSIVMTVNIIGGITVLPINRGADALLKKPASAAVQSIVRNDKEAKWAACNDIVSGQFLAANGAPCITSVNYMPNFQLWNTLDKDGAYNDIYNRYCHVSMIFTDEPTSFDLIGADLIRVNLSYEDMDDAQIKYLFSLSPIYEDSDYVDFEEIYHESNVFIYKVNYL
ncbi:MAG: hypothetical protein MSJ26_09730 [Oscillospiraceae bacterium]|nr:hypothetical protein [Oscillospiraceae bacterium]